MTKCKAPNCQICEFFMPIDEWDYCLKEEKDFNYTIYGKTPDWCPLLRRLRVLNSNLALMSDFDQMGKVICEVSDLDANDLSELAEQQIFDQLGPEEKYR